MNKKIAVLFLSALLLGHGFSAEAQTPRKLPHIGYLATDSRAPTLETFREGLRSFGYVEGKTILIDWRFAENNLDRFPELAAELVGLKLDVIVAANSFSVKALRRATTTIPIVMATYGGNPVADGIVASLARPGGNITGVVPLAADLSGKHIELLKEMIPKITRVAVLWNPDDYGAQSAREPTEAAAKGLGIQVSYLEWRLEGELEKLIETATRAHAEALVVLRGGLSYRLRQRIAAAAEKYRLPSIYYAAEFVEAGGLMSYSSNNEALYRRTAYYVDKILKGAKPAELPIEQPTKIELVINLKTAKQIGLTIPPNVLARADRVIK
jgi:putative ABC transport system substrate-binding protein